jgi:hypothetical protein
MPLETTTLGGAAKAAFRRAIFKIDREPDTVKPPQSQRP